MSSPPAESRRDRAEAVIARELASLAEANAGTLPRGYANRVSERLRAEGVGVRRQDALRLIRDYAEYLQIPGTVTQRDPERFTTARSSAAQVVKRKGALDVVALMRREGFSLAQAVQQHNRERPDQRFRQAASGGWCPMPWKSVAIGGRRPGTTAMPGPPT